MVGQSFRVSVIGVVDDEPRELSGNTYRFSLQVESIEEDGRGKTDSSAMILVTLFDAQVAPAYGDRIGLEGRLSIPPPVANPGQFDMRAWFFRQGISADLVTSGESATTLAHDRGHALVAAALRSRSGFGIGSRSALKETGLQLR